MRAGSAQLYEKHGLCIWREQGSEEWQVGVDEITDHLEALDIRYTVVVARRTVRRRLRPGFEVRVAWDNLAEVVRWVPSVQVLIDALKQAPSGHSPVPAAGPDLP